MNGYLTLEGGTVAGESRELSLSARIKLVDQPVDQLLEEMIIGDGKLKGRLNMDANIAFRGQDEKAILSSLSGSVTVSIEKGLIKNSLIFIKVLDFLSLQNIFKKRPPDLREEGLYFEEITGEASIKNGIIRSEDFKMKSPVFNAVAYGIVDLPQKKVDFVLLTQPLGTLDTLVSNIPILGYIITGKNKSILAYPFKIQGPISKPDVTFTPFDALGAGVGGILERLLLTPQRLIKGLDLGTRNLLKKDMTGRDE